jgi:hypothetical protein
LASNKNYNNYNFCGSLISCSNKNYKICKFFTYFVWLCTYSQESENKESKRRKVCRCGAGVEQTPDKCNTPGFPLRTEPELVHDLRGFDRLDLPQNHRKIVASSRWLLQGWRANCDIQVLLYECSPMYPNPDEIARVTDYIVAYACKGNETIVEEKQQMKALILGSRDISGTKSDVKRIAKQLLNRTIRDKVISKQECMCHLAKLNLYLCSESIETVSISGEYRLQASGGANSTVLVKYAKREDTNCNEMSLHQYFHHLRNPPSSAIHSNHKCVIPHYVGARTYQTYPPTEGYAKSVLIMHVPWRNTFNKQAEARNYVKEFKSFLESKRCPASVRIGYGRAKARHEKKKQFVEPTGRKETIFYESFSTTLDDSVEKIVAIASTLGLTSAAHNQEENEFFYGDESTNWANQHYKVCHL